MIKENITYIHTTVKKIQPFKKLILLFNDIDIK
jgi:hypothetical protein